MTRDTPQDPVPPEKAKAPKSWLDVPIRTQPDDVTCGPTCLHAVYAYHGLTVELERLIEEVPQLEGGGTLGVLLGIDALSRGFDAVLVTYNLHVFDPTWFRAGPVDLAAKLKRRWQARTEAKLRHAIEAYLHFLDLGGRIRFDDLTPSLLRRTLERRIPVLTALSATYLYASAREVYENERLYDDDVRGDPQGHFVVLSGYDVEANTVHVSDPLRSNPFANDKRYEVDMQRLLNSILLGIVTYDANLLMIQPRAVKDEGEHANTPGRRSS